jgi:branched-subunit amino acid transport protein AzlD
MPELIIILVVACVGIGMAAIMIVPYWKIYSKTGQAGAMALLQLIPVVNIVMLYILAFSEWPIEREMKASRERQGGPLS